MDDRSRLESLNNAAPSQANKQSIRSLTIDLDRLLALEEYYWCQHSRSEWLRGVIKIPSFSIKNLRNIGGEIEYADWRAKMEDGLLKRMIL